MKNEKILLKRLRKWENLKKILEDFNRIYEITDIPLELSYNEIERILIELLNWEKEELYLSDPEALIDESKFKEQKLLSEEHSRIIYLKFNWYISRIDFKMKMLKDKII